MYTLMNAFIMRIKTFYAVQVIRFSSSSDINTHLKCPHCWGVHKL